MFNACGVGLAVGGLLGYMGWMILNLIGSIKAIANDSESTCTVSSFAWIWWICISSAFFAYGTFLQAAKKHETGTVKQYLTQITLYWILSLGMAIGTQFQYLDGCDGPAHTVLFIYMWGNYAVVMCITLCAACVWLDECTVTALDPPIPCDEPPVPYSNPCDEPPV